MEVDEELVAIGAQIKAARSRLNMTAEALAQATGIALSMISKYETGRHEVKATKLRLIADATGVSTDYLLGRATDTDEFACLPRGWVLVDMAMVRRILSSKETSELQDIVIWQPRMLQWAIEIPQDFALLPAKRYADLSAEVQQRLTERHSALSAEWFRRLDEQRKAKWFPGWLTRWWRDWSEKPNSR